MTSSEFAPDLNLPGPGLPGSGGDEVDNSDRREIFLYPPYTRTGTVTFFNWLGADKSGFDGKHNIKDKSQTPGVREKVFSQIPDNKIFNGANRPYTFHGKNQSSSSNGVDKLYISGPEEIEDLFQHTYDDRVRWETCWSGYYQKGSGNKWWQYWNTHVYNSTDSLYPFATKGISFRIRIPSGDEEVHRTKGGGSGNNYGNNMQLNRAWGLWRDLNGLYYIYRMYVHGDNRYFASGNYNDDLDDDGNPTGDDGDGSKPRPKEGGPITQKDYPDRIDNALREWWGDRYFSLEKEPNESGNLPVEVTDDMLQKNIIAKKKEKGCTLISLEPNVEHLFFCGFSLEFHHNRKAGSKRNHSYLLSRLTPIPYYSPRSDRRTYAVLGEPTPISMLKEGFRKIHFWDPPKEYFRWEDDLEYDDTEPIEDGDSVTGDGDTIWVPADTFFVNEEGDPAPIPANVFLNERNEMMVVRGTGVIRTLDDSDLIDTVRAALSDLPENDPDRVVTIDLTDSDDTVVTDLDDSVSTNSY